LLGGEFWGQIVVEGGSATSKVRIEIHAKTHASQAIVDKLKRSASRRCSERDI
jgi:hypothetical protein